MSFDTMDNVQETFINTDPELQYGLLNTPGFFEKAHCPQYQDLKDHSDKYASGQDNNAAKEAFEKLLKTNFQRLIAKYKWEFPLLLFDKTTFKTTVKGTVKTTIKAKVEDLNLLLTIEGCQNEYRSFFNSSEPCKATENPAYDDTLPQDRVMEGFEDPLVKIDNTKSYIIVHRVQGNNLLALYIPLDERVSLPSKEWLPCLQAHQKASYYLDNFVAESRFVKDHKEPVFYGHLRCADQYRLWAPWKLPPFPLGILTSDSTAPGMPFMLSQPRISAWDALKNGDPGSTQPFYIFTPIQNVDVEMSDADQQQPPTLYQATLAQGSQMLAVPSGPISITTNVGFLSTFQPLSTAPMLGAPQGWLGVTIQNPGLIQPHNTILETVKHDFKASFTSLMIAPIPLDQNWLAIYNANTSVDMDSKFPIRGGRDRKKKKATTNAQMDSQCPVGFDIQLWQEACSLEKDDGIVLTPGLDFNSLVARSVAYAKFRLRYLGFLDANGQPTAENPESYPGSVRLTLNLPTPPDCPTGTSKARWDNAIKNTKECLRCVHRNDGGNVAKYIKVVLTPGAFVAMVERKIRPR